VRCGASILPGETYFRETIADRFLHSLHSRVFCRRCYDMEGEALLSCREELKRDDHGLDKFVL
jgi:hypothetical protein